ncbi:RNA polymerase sigma factor [Brevundimonas sp.]|uniref:RNA polymerase sigma factor n=1 Tax=Brevundimonas sp. TaxID=1871086 RepID=UPI003BAD37F4
MSKSDAMGEGRAGAGAQSRLDRLYRRYSPWLTARLRRRYGADAEDIVQDAWMRLAPIDAGLEIRSPKAFLLTLASNIAMSRARRDRRRSEILDAEAPTQAKAQSPDQIDAVLLEEIIGRLPQPLRDVFVLSRIVGMSTVQISEALGISPKTVEWRMTRALARCSAELRR